MEIDISPIRNKQRIYIGGNLGVDNIFELCKKLLARLGKPADFYTVGESSNFTDAPIVLIKGGTSKVNGVPLFRHLDAHILLIHRIGDQKPEGYDSLEEYVQEMEKMADALPKAGTLLYLEDDNLSVMIGKNEREDVKAIDYAALKGTTVAEGFVMKDGTLIKTENKMFAYQAAAAKALLNRIGITGEQFSAALKEIA